MSAFKIISLIKLIIRMLIIMVIHETISLARSRREE